jgi:hypothetical protein
MAAETVIAAHPPNDGRDYDCQCARCGSSVSSERCASCDGTGYVDLDQPGYDEGGLVTCDECFGVPVFHACLSSPEWCQSHPRPGRENVERGEIEWYVIESEDA